MKATYAAFYLLSDCLWDMEAYSPSRGPKGYWDRDHSRDVIRSACLIRFWDYQVNTHHVWSRVGLDKLQELVDDEFNLDSIRVVGDEKVQMESLLISFKARVRMRGFGEVPLPPVRQPKMEVVKVQSNDTEGFACVPSNRHRPISSPIGEQVTWKRNENAAPDRKVGVPLDSPKKKLLVVDDVDDFGIPEIKISVAPSKTRIIVRDEGEPGSPRSDNELIVDSNPWAGKKSPAVLNHDPDDGGFIGFGPDPDEEARKAADAALRARINHTRRLSETTAYEPVTPWNSTVKRRRPE
ncbi:MAG: hypothetical protein WCO84_07280 [bacterium]